MKRASVPVAACAGRRAESFFRPLPTLPGLIFLALAFSSCHRPERMIELRGQTMGTTYSIKVVGEVAHPESLQQGIDSLLGEINRQMSTYRDDSEIRFFNESRDTQPFLVSPEFAAVVERSLTWSGKTNGAFDITIFPLLRLWGFAPDQPYPPQLAELPADEAIHQALQSVGFQKLRVDGGRLVKQVPEVQIDLGAIAKGYGVDAVAEFLEKVGYTRYLVEIGGEVRCRGTNARGVVWTVGVRKPDRGAADEQPEWVLQLADSAVATSGDYESFAERDGVFYSHELDPRTGRPSRSGVASATVTGPRCMDVDALATALMVLEPAEGMRVVESLEGFEALLVVRRADDSFELLKSGGMKVLERRNSVP